MNPISINCHTTGDGFEIIFKNGRLDVPDQKGGYIISSGCGSGKTESIKQLITQKADQGIMYCVDTIAEVDKMYNWILDNNVLPASEILRLHGNEEARDDLEEYWERPETVMCKKVILLTHIRFWTDLINYFMIYLPSSPVPVFDGNFAALMGRDDLRRYIIFDETPVFFKPFVTFSRPSLGCFSEKVSGKWQCKVKAELRDSYNTFISDTKSDFGNKSHVLGRIKRDVVLECIPRYWNAWKEMEKGAELNISFYPHNLCQDVMKAYVLVYEGAGDVLLNDAKPFKLLNIEKKYDVSVTFQNIPAPQERNQNFDKVRFEETINTLHELLRGRLNEKTLIVVWKNIGTDRDDESCGKSEWARLIDARLMSLGFMSGREYSITYFGSNKTKSTNEYRDYTGIILLGDWTIPNTSASSIRNAFMSRTTTEDYRLWYYVQLLSRIGIRNLDGGTYQVWYSSDYKVGFIKTLSDYFNNNAYLPSVKPLSSDWLGEVILKRAIKIRKETKVEIEKLVSYASGMKDAILNGQGMTLNISLDKLYELCPRSVKKSYLYERGLGKALGYLDIVLNITT